MTLNPASLASATDHPFASRRDVLAAATALLAAAATGSSAEAATGAEGYFLVFEKSGGSYNPNDPEARVFFIPSSWLEMFEVTDFYKTNYPTTGPNSWLKVLEKISKPPSPGGGAPGKKHKFHALYADTTEPAMDIPFPNRTVIPATPPGAGQTYLAAMLAPMNLQP
ncbi:hypothetical protein HPT29_020425 [Microvirga terrae]|uniref:Gluconate 2-dehydrogenase subunit 3 family protein n=1 Tax=Microvirga terrae TaxID=2740529 RepID=A0ABY5RP73_9HYPH|nr:hypothetical protein [Microvirga terrae]UVF18823.1 hypothetical protein HPT29_020425 [Microvirga terrae]